MSTQTWTLTSTEGEPMVDCVNCEAELPDPVDDGQRGVQVCDKCGAEQPALMPIPDDYTSTSTAVGQCNRCQRFTWSRDEVGTEDRMPQPDGNPCGGRIVAVSS